MPAKNGTTLVELLTTLAVTATLMCLALPAFDAWTLHRKRDSSTEQLLGALQVARQHAVLHNRAVSLCSGADRCNRSTRWSESLLVFTDQNLNGQLDAEDQLLHSARLPANSQWIWSNFRQASFISYRGDGTTHATNGTFTLCTPEGAQRQIVISITGRARLKRPSAHFRC